MSETAGGGDRDRVSVAAVPDDACEYVVVSDGHGLVTWARRLALQGHTVHTYTMRPAYRHAWSSVMPVALAPRSDKPAAWGDVGARVLDGSATLLTDSRKVMDTFAGAPLGIRCRRAGRHSG